MKEKKAGALGVGTWSSTILFGLIGQIAWVVENMYFSRFMQNEITREAYATTLLVAFSAIFATVSTLVGGALCDRTGKRKVYISVGYIIWGFTIAMFAFIPMNPSKEKILPMVILVVAMDCVMSVIGSISNDAAFNTWVTDISNTANRAKVDTVLAVMPLISMAIVFVGFDPLANAEATPDDWKKFFVILGMITTVGGIIGIFLMKDKAGIKPNKDNAFISDFTYSLQPKVIKENKMLYWCLAGNMISAVGYQVYVSYLFNIVEGTMGIESYILPIGIIMVVSAIGSVVISSLMDKYGKRNFYYPVIIVGVLGNIIIWASRFFIGGNQTLLLAILIVGGIMIIGVSLVMAGLFTASYRDYIPEGKEGLFQGCRMVMYVLVPMIIGPLVAQFIIGLANPGVENEADIVYPMELFLGAAFVTLFCFIPARIVRNNEPKHHEELLEKMKNKAK